MSRLFEEFQKKNHVQKKSKVTSKSMPKDVVIAIPLKSNADKKIELDDNFVKVIEYEYAVKYLELMGVSPSPKMIANLLKNHPLSSCELSSGWSKTGWLADVIYIHPKKTSKKQKLENKRSETLVKSVSQPNFIKKPTLSIKKSFLESTRVKTDAYKIDHLRLESDRPAETRKKEVNMDPAYWKKKFLYPFLIKDELTAPKVQT